MLARIVCMIFMLVGVLSAQDIVGRWAGVADTTDEAGTKRQEKQTIEIKNVDGKLTGTTVSSSGKAGIAFKIEQSETKFNFYGFLDFEGGEHLRWKFELKEGKLVGTFSALHDNPAKWVFDRIGPMTLAKQ